MTGLQARGLRLGYGNRVVVDDLDLDVEPGTFTAIIGPNGCGKSTVLKALARVLRPLGGQVLLGGVDVHSMRSKVVATRLALLPQDPIAPEGITVRTLVARGRHPHHSALRMWVPGDAEAIESAMAATGIAALNDRYVGELSGGQRQRVWLAMVLAQDTDHVLLDEPTSFLDVAHQIDLLHLCQDIQQAGRTVVAVLHDLNQAARYADRLIVLQEGRIVAQGAPAAVMTADLVREVFGLEAVVVADPQVGSPLVIPLARP